jgi:hypothetical protein
MFACIVGAGCDERRWRGRAALICQTQGGSTALILAAENGTTDCVRLLVESGADMDVINNVRSLNFTRACFVVLCVLENEPLRNSFSYRAFVHVYVIK